MLLPTDVVHDITLQIFKCIGLFPTQAQSVKSFASHHVGHEQKLRTPLRGLLRSVSRLTCLHDTTLGLIQARGGGLIKVFNNLA